MASLLVNADDFGLHASVNAAIASCVDFGSVNSVSVIANGAAPDFPLLRQFAVKQIFTGIHITWIGEPWMTDSTRISNWKELIQKMIFGRKEFQSKMKREADTQIDWLIANGVYPDHIDSHQHIHHLPALWDIAIELQKKYNIKRIRVAHAGSLSLIRKNIPGIALHVMAAVKKKQNENFSTAGLKYTGHYNQQLLADELKISSGNNTELIVHPGGSNDLLNQSYSHWHFDWEKEFAALSNTAFLQAISDQRFYMLKK